MKNIYKSLFGLVALGLLFFPSCKKEYSCTDCGSNQPGSNTAPIAMAGANQLIQLPLDSVVLDGTASHDPDGTIQSWSWAKITGPASFSFRSNSSARTVVGSLTPGSYHFELTVTDNGGLNSKDTVQVIVKDPSQPNRPPVARAGADQVLVWPLTAANLDGSGSTDPDNDITSYRWSLLTGPAPVILSNAMQVLATDLIPGDYFFELWVTDGWGLFSKDTVRITVNGPASCAVPVNQACDNSTRQQVCAKLVLVGNLTVPRAGIAAVTAGNKIFYAGGHGSSGCLSRVDIYDLSTQTWDIAELSIPRTYIAAAAAGDKVIFAGGNICTGSRSSRVDIYDLNQDAWSTAELSQARNDIVTATVGSKIFLAGGYTGNGVSGVIDIYEGATNTWSVASLHEPRSVFSATTADQKIYFAGGWNGIDGSTASTRIDIYDNVTASWSVSALNSPRSYMASFFKNGKIYWAGGSDYVDWANGNTSTCNVEVRDVHTQVSTSANLLRANWDFDAFERNNKIVFLPGWPWGTILPMQFDIFDAITNNWTIGVLHEWSNGTIIAANNVIYIAGGFKFINGSNQYQSQIWRLDF